MKGTEKFVKAAIGITSHDLELKMTIVSTYDILAAAAFLFLDKDKVLRELVVLVIIDFTLRDMCHAFVLVKVLYSQTRQLTVCQMWQHKWTTAVQWTYQVASNV